MEGMRRRMSPRLSGILDTATKAVAKLTERDQDPEEDPEFLARNPRWEDQLPGVGVPAEGKAQTTAALLAALDELPKPDADSSSRQNWRRAYKAVKRLMVVFFYVPLMVIIKLPILQIMRKKARRSAVGTGARMEGHALGIWGPYSNARLKLFMFLYSQKVEYFLLILICAHLTVLVFQVEAGSHGQRWTRVRIFKLDVLDGFITGLYTIEMLLRIACLGLYKNKHGFLRNPYNRLDFVIVIDSWAHIIVRSVTGSDYFARIAVFRVFRALLVLKHVAFVADVIAIMAAVKRSVGPLQNVILLTFFLLVFYALLGTQFLQGTMSSRCKLKTDLRMAYPVRYCDKKVLDGYVCPSNQKCMKGQNPNWGVTSFDIFYYSLLTMFQIVTLEGWSVIMYIVKDAEGERANSYFMTLVVIGTYFLINVFIAGISGVFLRVRAEHQALLKKSKRNQTSFYNATVMANVLRDEIIKDDAQMSWYHRFFNRTARVRRDLVRAISRTHTSVRSAFQSGSFRLSRSFSRMSSRNRSLSRSMTMGVKAAVTIHEHARAITDHSKFNMGVLLAVTVNAAVLCVYHYGMSQELVYILYGIQAVFLVIFGVELLLRFLAYGPTAFYDDKMNLVDLVLVPVSAAAVASRSYPNISAVRIMRWFWLSKKHVDKNPSVVATCIRSAGSLSSIFFFYLLVTFVTSLISMELFSGQYDKFPDGFPRANHDYLLQAMLLWFSVTTAEQWPNQMWNSMRPGVLYNGIAPFIYVFYFTVTAHIIMNLIIAVLLEYTELTDNEKKQIQRVEHMKLIRRMQSRAFTRSGSWVVGAVEGFKAGLGSLGVRGMNVKPVKPGSRKGNERRRGHERRLHADPESQIPGLVSGEAGSSGLTLPAASTAAAASEAPASSSSVGGLGAQRRRSSQILQSSGFTEDIGERRGSRTALQDAVLTLSQIGAAPLPKSPSTLTRSASSMNWGRSLSRTASKRQSFELSDYEELEKKLTTMERPWYLREGSLLLFGEKSAIKYLCTKILQNKWYWWFTIGLSVYGVWLVVEMQPNGEPIVSQHFPPAMITVSQKIVFAVFALDCAMKIIAHGLIFSPDAYLSDWYNVLDLFILVVDGVYLGTWSQTSRRAIDALLAFRPFRFVVRISGLRTLMSNLTRTIPAVVSVLLFTFAILLVFATVAVQHFRGLLWSCSDYSISSRAYCTGQHYNTNGLLVPRTWSNSAFHFDDIGNALLSLFVCSTFDNWVTNWLYPVMDINGLDNQPVRDKHPANSLFFVAFCCAGGFFIIRVLIGVFINEFGKNSGSKLLTERQKLWRDMNRIIQKTKASPLPRPPKNYIRKKCFYYIRHPVYKALMIVALLGYSFFLSTNQAGQPAYVSNRRQKAHVAITTYFLLESIMKFLGDEWRVYKNQVTRQMEFGLSIMAAAGLMGLKGTIRGYIGRTAYITRVFCIIPNVPRARIIMRTMFICLPTVGEIMALLAVFLFAFAGIGFQMFNHVAHGNCIGPTLNFKTFVNSFITIFQVTTLDNWSCIMNDVMLGPPFCTNGNTLETNDCGYPVAGIIYFACVIVVCSHIFMNLFVAVILDAITFGLVNENSMVTPEHLLAYKELWMQKRFDPEATGYIGLHKLKDFVNALGVPLGRRHNSPTAWYARIEYEVLSFRVPNKGIPFKDLLETLTLYKIGPTGLPLSLRIEREKRIQTVYVTGATTRIQALVRGFLTRRRAAAGNLGSRAQRRGEVRGALLVEEEKN